MSSQDPHPQSTAASRLLLKEPQPVLESVFAFPPNRATLGGTAYFIVENKVNILVDCPAWNEATETFLRQHGGVHWLALTHRGGIGDVSKIQQAFQAQVLVQEQEAYLLPQVEQVIPFHQDFTLTPAAQMLWTPGHSPGSACLYYNAFGGVLFSGRHLLPDAQGQPMPLRVSKTFHWPRQLHSVKALRERFSSETLQFLCPGANTGFLRGQKIVDHAYEKLAQLNLEG